MISRASVFMNPTIRTSLRLVVLNHGGDQSLQLAEVHGLPCAKKKPRRSGGAACKCWCAIGLVSTRSAAGLSVQDMMVMHVVDAADHEPPRLPEAAGKCQIADVQPVVARGASAPGLRCHLCRRVWQLSAFSVGRGRSAPGNPAAGPDMANIQSRGASRVPSLVPSMCRVAAVGRGAGCGCGPSRRSQSWCRPR